MLPGHLHAGIHPVLLSDPWPHADDVETRSRDARAIMAWLHANAPAGGTANQVFLGMQAAAQAADSDAAAAVSAGRASSSDNTSTSPATAAAAAPPRLFASEGYVRGLLERLRLDRFLQSKLNVAERTINPAARDYPRLYVPLLDQVAKFGRPRDIARRTRQRDETVMTRALKRLRNGKPPFPIFRRTAVSSRFHYEVALEAARAHTAAAQAAVAQWQGQAQGGVAPAGQEARKPAA